MPRVVFTPNLHRFFACTETTANGQCVREVLENVFSVHPEARGYILDDQAGLRRHMTVFVDGQMIRDRSGLSDAVADDGTVYVFQALSGG